VETVTVSYVNEASEAINPDLASPIFSPTTKMAVALAANRDQRGLHIYAGTVPAKTTAKRRAANKVARQSRKANR
jgi:hypothetical protein